MVVAALCFIAVIVLFWFMFSGPKTPVPVATPNKKHNKNKNELPCYHPESIKAMFRSHGWNERKILELSIEHCTNMFHDEAMSDYARERRMEWLDSRKVLEQELKNFDEQYKTVITHLPLSTDKDEVFKMCQDDAKLIQSILEYKNQLKQKHIETFDQKENIIITEKGYYCAFFMKDLKKAES